MGEIKSVKVDNWGVFFLQKLQNFFNKTDYCDLTLQFKDNSQLKVHRLVLSACTDFFNVLEQTCELMDDALVMPLELQADVVVPIVNFMYTGTLEFELKMYNKLLKTAKEMNMTVLLKLLEAHKRTMEGSRQVGQKPGSPKHKGKRTATNSPSITKFLSSPSTVTSTQQTQRRLVTTATPATPMRRIITGKPMPGSNVFRQVSNSMLKASPKMQRGPTRFETMDTNVHPDTYETSFDAISYESKPLKEEPEEYEEMQGTPTKSRSSPFEQLRKGYNNNKRPAVSTFTSPPAKKPNIEDVKEFSEQQRMRKQIAAEYGDDAEYDGVMDDEFHNDDDDDEPNAAGGPSSSSSARQQQQLQQGAQPQASIIIKQSPNEKPTIVVKDSSNSKMDHAKIISEVLRQYPHLVKSNKNIKLKIMPNIGGQSQKIVVKKETIDSVSAELEQNKAAGGAQQARQQLLQLSQKGQTILKSTTIKPSLTSVTSTKVEAQTTATAGASGAIVAASAIVNAAPPQKRRIDSKTMHALIALGAENTTGPWLCLRCGVNGRPISIPSYRGFRRHLINTHKEVIDSALCEHCGWRSTNNRVLNHHILVEHKISSPLYVFPKCEHCEKICLDPNDLEVHIGQVHPDSHKQQCIYCNKVFSKEMLLYNHMKTFHKKRAREDGVIDFSDDELNDFDDELVPESTSTVDKKIKIISDISLPSTILKLDEVPATIEEEYANDSGPKFVNAEGNEMLLTAEQREEIMSQLEQDHEGGVVMVLNESAFPPGEDSVVVGHEAKLETSEAVEEYDDHNIYNEFPPEGEAAFTGNVASTGESALDISKTDEGETHEHQESDRDERMDEDDHMEWAENVISAHDANDDDVDGDEDDEEEEEQDEEAGAKDKPVKAGTTKEDEEKVSSSKSPSDTVKEEKKDRNKEDDINLKLKMLTGDWSDDELDDDEDQNHPTVQQNNQEKPNVEPSVSSNTDAAEKSTSEDTDKELQKSAKGEEEESQQTSAAAIEEELSQSSQSEKVKEPDSKIKKDTLDEKLPEEDSIKMVDTVSDILPSETEIEADGKQKIPSSSKETKPRRKSTKDVVAEQKVEGEKDDLDDFIGEAPLNVKITSPKKIDEDPLVVVKEEEDAKPIEIKTEILPDKDDTVTSTKSQDEALKTVDKVKSLISEWADDEDDI